MLPVAPIELAELFLGASQADAEPFCLAEPAFAFGFGDAGDEVVADLLQPAALCRVRPEERTSDTCLTELILKKVQGHREPVRYLNMTASLAGSGETSGGSNLLSRDYGETGPSTIVTLTAADLEAGVRDDGTVSSEPEGPRAERPKRRRFSAEYKLAIVAEYDALTEPGAKGAPCGDALRPVKIGGGCCPPTSSVPGAS
ncbi:hypothetical protein [Streptosporangium roseum]|uniref:hypothetical protein n=1 Tax=Streptosporangium roseum TaxID=2001 RepID=UPI0007C6D53F|nr:hypothetical protein [Streptosporangium roseum]